MVRFISEKLKDSFLPKHPVGDEIANFQFDVCGTTPTFSYGINPQMWKISDG
jgi:hypothetical protein